MKTWCKIIALLCMLPFVSACSGDEPAPEPDPQPAEVGRTVLVYMVARNSLGTYDFDTDDIREMSEAARNGAFGKNRLILFHSTYGSAPSLKEVTPDGVKVLKSYSQSFSAVESRNMSAVIADVKAVAPARRYGIVLWSHADGWMQTGISDVDGRKRAFGDDGGKCMNVTTLANVLRGEDFDFVYFDCCFMGGVEVAYQLRDVTGRVVASPSELPSPGMPYDKTLPFLMADEADVAGAAKATFDSYNALTGNARTCTMTVVDTGLLPDLAEKVRELYMMHPQLGSVADVQQFAGVRSSFYNRYFDLGHYMELLSRGEDAYSEACRAASEMLGRCVVYSDATPYLWEHDAFNSIGYEVKVDNYSGLSTFILQNPSMSTVSGYDELDWYRDVASALF
ncbi:MAG: hypothetical protein K2L78_02350 [Muribaculaceae bacterium]|nr:hypothetical protein [Muribaculaceae bacterium]